MTFCSGGCRIRQHRLRSTGDGELREHTTNSTKLSYVPDAGFTDASTNYNIPAGYMKHERGYMMPLLSKRCLQLMCVRFYISEDGTEVAVKCTMASWRVLRGRRGHARDGGSYDVNGVWKVADVALKYTAQAAAERPNLSTMTDVRRGGAAAGDTDT